MHNRKIEKIKQYSRIIKQRKRNGEIEEIMVQVPQREIEEVQHEQLSNQEFQDPIQDQYEEEEEWISQGEESNQGEPNQSGTMMSQQKQAKMEEEVECQESRKQIYLGNNKNLNKGEVLQFDNKAYDMLHRLNVEWPSMSIDFVAKASPFDAPLTNFQQMNAYPYQIFTVQGSCNNSAKNSIYFTKWSNLCQTKYDDDPEGQDEDNPEIVVQEIQTTFDVNRLRTLNNSPIVAFWNDDGKNGQVRIMDLSNNLQKLRNNVGSKRREKGKQVVIQFPTSGYALGWNPHKVGELVVGDNSGKVSVLTNNANYTHWQKTSEYGYHNGSVQDLVFSPEQSFVFASCSSDGTLQVVDMRVGKYNKAQIRIKAHRKDVNVCDWNRVATHLLVTGSDDCSVKVWDLRLVSDGVEEELLNFNWHTEPITSIKFQPNDQSVMAVASEDNRVSLWDLSMQNQEGDPEVPNELMFVHQGQQEIKEIAFHPVYFEMLVSTSLDAINIFKPALQMPEPDLDERADKQDLKRPPIQQQDLDKYIERMSLQ